MEQLREKIVVEICGGPSWAGYREEAEAIANAILSLPEIDPTPLHQRILALLGGIRDDMLPEDVSAVQRFAERAKVRP